MTKYLLAILVLLTLLPASAQNQMELNAKAKKEFEAADKEVQMLVKDIQPRLDSRTQKAFGDAQAAWLKYRDADGELWGIYNMGGMEAEMIYYQKMADVTRQRAIYLRQWTEQFSF